MEFLWSGWRMGKLLAYLRFHIPISCCCCCFLIHISIKHHYFATAYLLAFPPNLSTRKRTVLLALLERCYDGDYETGMLYGQNFCFDRTILIYFLGRRDCRLAQLPTSLRVQQSLYLGMRNRTKLLLQKIRIATFHSP